MTIISFVTYRSFGPPINAIERDCKRFIKVIKGDSSDQPEGLDIKSRSEALDWFGELAALTLKSKQLFLPIVLIPIPNSDCSLSSVRIPRTLALADAVAEHIRGAVVSDCLRWRHSLRPSHLGGTRNPQRLYKCLVVKEGVKSGTLVLVDDIVSSGSHVRAAAAKLSRLVFPCVYAICAGHTEWQNPSHCFSIGERVIPDFRPGHC